MKRLFIVAILLCSFSAKGQDFIDQKIKGIVSPYIGSETFLKAKEFHKDTPKHRLYVHVLHETESGHVDTIFYNFYMKGSKVDYYTKIVPRTIYWEQLFLTWMEVEKPKPFGDFYTYFGKTPIYAGYYYQDKSVTITEDPSQGLLIYKFKSNGVSIE